MTDLSQCLDTGDEFAFDKSYSQTQIVRSVADALMQFLASLPVPIIPPSFHGRCELVGDQNEAFEVVSELPGPSLNVRTLGSLRIVRIQMLIDRVYPGLDILNGIPPLHHTTRQRPHT